MGGSMTTLLIVAGLWSVAADATHEVDHRFSVVGAVTYEDETPIPREKVAVLGANEAELVSVRTDEKGLYRIVLHLHDPDLGKVFDLRVRDQTKKVRVHFTPGDKRIERGTRVDFVLPR